jgi:hypothetical protein
VWLGLRKSEARDEEADAEGRGADDVQARELSSTHLSRTALA